MAALTEDQQRAQLLRRAARRFATGVTVVAARYDGGTHALTANSFVTLSLHPPLVGISVRPEGRMRRHIELAGRFGISVLGAAQIDYARHFASPLRLELLDRMPPLTTDDPPRVPSCVAFFACDFAHIHPVGDHDLIVGSVVTCDTTDLEVSPLIFLDGEFQSDLR